MPRGPCNMWVLRNCWSNGVVDENTLVWGQGLADWLPMKNVRMLIPQIRTPEGELASEVLLCPPACLLSACVSVRVAALLIDEISGSLLR